MGAAAVTAVAVVAIPAVIPASRCGWLLLACFVLTPSVRARQVSPPAAERAAAAAPVVRFGRVVDVYGRRVRAGAHVIELHARGVVVGPGVLAPMAPGCSLLPGNPDSGRKRLLIEAELGSAGFAATLARLQAATVELAERVPGDAALLVCWPAGTPPAEAGDSVELLEIDRGQSLPITTTVHADGCVVDTVLSGSEALRREQRPMHALPPTRLQLRVRRGGVESRWTFRARDLLPDPEPLRIVGEMTVYLERVRRLDEGTRLLTLYFGGIRQAVDRGDVLRVLDAATGRPVAVLEVLEDVPLPAGEGLPRAHVRVRAEGAAVDELLDRLDPSRLPGYPRHGGAARDAFVQAQGPKVTLVALFDPEAGDDAANFVRIPGRDLVDSVGQREGVSPHASFVVRFSGPVDPASLSGLRLVDADAAVGNLIAARCFALDDAGREFRLQPPLGLRLDSTMRERIRADRARPPSQRASSFVFEACGGVGGVTSSGGGALSGSLRLGFVLDPDAADNHVVGGGF